MESANAVVTGEATVKLYKGQASVVGRRSDRSLYVPDLATYDEGDRFDHTKAEGFVQLWGLPTKVWAQRQGPGAQADEA
jgi:argininosuccinate synthase